MDNRGRMMLRVLINRYNPKAGNTLLKFLPEDEAKEIMNQNIYSSDLLPILHSRQSISTIHYSWIQPLLDNFPKSLHHTVISVLTNQQIAGLTRSPPVPVSEVVKAFLCDKLYQYLNISDHLPVEYLPATELTPLSKWTKVKLVNLADFLGIYDLASEVRSIVNTNYLKNIYSCLSTKQFTFLKQCLNKKDQLASPKLGIDPTVKDCKKLKKVIHKRGLIRLGRALRGQHPDLLWHITHILDSTRGSIVANEYQPQETPKITKILRLQILTIIGFLENG